MASETEYTERSSLIDGLINSRNRDLSLFLPFMLGLNTTFPLQNSTNPPQESQNQATPPDRVILVNPLTQGMVVIEASGSGLDSLLRDMFLNKDGQPPASKASIEALRSVEIVGNENNEECVICLEEWEAGQMAKEMPCKHRFHGNCIKKWLEIHGSCPICRYKMPVDDDDDVNAKSNGENNRGRREIWVSFTFNRDTRNGENNQIVHSEDESLNPIRRTSSFIHSRKQRH
ncbi:E3 ubiquitin-protein ligase SIRP1 isoform X3 [Olea europaea var. sylvestris]|uniref:E3 ubiquitin-protein ligase SIRP1 isoform X3 n=1 Tax=Olea europaea var. sylvestris TaxID=158386 RepID=UPI000C1D5E2B|nr:E3 ubiquitin-protein ligase SIRP1 isoform X3 [Olea europaea var. sylvestris]